MNNFFRAELDNLDINVVLIGSHKLAIAMDSILFQGSKVWADALKDDCRLRILSSVQRTAALRLASAYRIVSKSAILAISVIIPISL